MYGVSWKEIQSNGNQPIRMKTFATEERRQAFLDDLTASGAHIEILSLGAAELADFKPGVRVKIEKALHTEFIGKTGTVVKAVKKTWTVWVEFDEGGTYGSYAWNLRAI